MRTQKLNKKKAAAMLEEAKLHLAAGDATRAEELLQEVAFASEVSAPVFFAVLADAQARQDKYADAVVSLEEGLRRFPHEPDLEARLGNALVLTDRVEEGLRHFERAKARLGRQAEFLVQYALALVRAGRLDEAENALSAAAAAGGGPQARLMTALVWGRRGRYAEAEKLARSVEEASATKNPELSSAAAAMRADAKLFQGDAAGALALWKDLRRRGVLEDDQLGHMAYAAQLAGEPELCDELVSLRTERGPLAEDLLLFAQISNLRGRPQEALTHLAASERAGGERHPGHAFEMLATRGRALRLLGEREKARAALDVAAAMPEAASGRLGPKVRVDLGHLAAEEGDFERASAHFLAAQAMDPSDPEAKHALSLTERRVAWRTELEASAQARIEAAQAEAEALRRRFLSREGELEGLRRELERMKAAQRDTEEKAHRVVTSAVAEQEKKVREELWAREQEIEEKAVANVERALGPHPEACPAPLKNLLLVAERTFQKALYTELPAAAVAVLFSGALERALFVLFVERFEAWLDEQGARAAFLQAAVRERRGKRVEYFDHFVEAFDRERAGKAPSLGEVGRALERRREPYLRPFVEFLKARYAVSDDFYDQLAQFVSWSKEKLRDPVAHGRGIDLGYEELKRFREQLLFHFGAAEHGLLALLLSPSPAGRGRG
ncbi:MAG: hypothetical protein ACOZIN_17840 [Myxococcota bacterium]